MAGPPPATLETKAQLIVGHKP